MESSSLKLYSFPTLGGEEAFPVRVDWNPWVPMRFFFFCLGGILGKNPDFRLFEKKEGFFSK